MNRYVSRRPLVALAVLLLLCGAFSVNVFSHHTASYAWLQIPQFTDSNGNPVAGGLLYSYTTGTTTPLSTYADATGTLNANPVVLDAAGRAAVYLLRGTGYKLVLRTAAGVSVWQRDPVKIYDDPAAPVVPLAVPSGTILPYGGTAAPTGYLLCDGTSYLRADYPDLFGIIGTAYGSIDSAHFTVPDMRGRFPFGLAASGTGSTLGGTFGTITTSIPGRATRTP